MSDPQPQTAAKIITRLRKQGFTVRGGMGTFMLIPKQDLSIDHSYQRGLIASRVQKLAKDWDWMACGALIVVLRPDGTFWVPAGQHRHAASLLLDWITELPCLVWEVDSVPQEAGVFLRSADVHHVPAVQQFKALLMTGDKDALVVNELIESVGRVPANHASGATVTCLQACINSVRTDEEAMRRVWPLIAEICKGDTLSGQIVRAVFYVETHLPAGVSLTDARWRRRVRGLTLKDFTDAMNAAAGHLGNRHTKSLAEGIVRAIDKKAKHKLPWGANVP